MDVNALYEKFNVKYGMSKYNFLRTYFPYLIYPSDKKRLDCLITEIEFSEKNQKILDVVCGPGWASIFEKDKGYDVTSVDFDENALKEINAIDECLGNIMSIDKASLTELGYVSEFDVIFSFEVLEQIENIDGAMSKLRTALKDNGTLVISVPNGFGSYALWQDYFIDRFVHKHLLKRFCSIRSCHINSIYWWIHFFHKHQFEIKTIENVEFISPWIFLFTRNKNILSIDLELANVLPKQIVSGWVFVLKGG